MSLILCPARISLNRILTSILGNFSGDVATFDVGSAIGRNRLFVNTQMRRFSYGIRNRWDAWFLKLANEYILNEVSVYKPGLVMVYNSEFLLPETCLKIRQKAKLVFFLGDSPFYTPQNDYYLACLSHADLVLVPDTFWMAQLNTMGLDRTLHFIPGIDETVYHSLGGDEAAGEEETDILYAGTSYKNSWGYRKAVLMSRLSGFNTRIYGNDAWERWFPFFPELEPLFRRSDYIPSEKLNRMFNRTKIIPVDGNPSIINGAHLRLLEALAAGTLPLIEYRKDVVDEIFRDSGINLPVIRSYREAPEVASYWLANDAERIETIGSMRAFFQEKYSAEKNASRISERLGI
ncbi:MAG: glycosyltransferase family 1 protein [Bacteroidales bacterium]|nr:glycosyltransferase family 1 protein [Bacteroidales bacterium]